MSEGRDRPLRIALFGHPVGHSRSKELFEAPGAVPGYLVSYEPVDVVPGHLPLAMGDLRIGRWDAANVTIPHKQDALHACDDVHASARVSGAVNAIVLRANGALSGANTDGAGFLDAVADYAGGNGSGAHFDSAVILGSGGAARGVAAALAGRGVRPVLVARNPATVDPLLAGLGSTIVGWSDPSLAERVRRATLVVQTTPLGTAPSTAAMVPLAPEALRPGQLVVDLVYNPWETRFLAMARAQGARAINGWPMLVHQAARALDFWFGPGRGGDLVAAAARFERRDPSRP